MQLAFHRGNGNSRKQAAAGQGGTDHRFFGLLGWAVGPRNFMKNSMGWEPKPLPDRSLTVAARQTLTSRDRQKV
jgi:hypothetical protein